MPYHPNVSHSQPSKYGVTFEDRLLFMLNYIITFKRLHGGLSPTIYEIAGYTRHEPHTVVKHLALLEERGEIMCNRGGRRDIRVRGERYICDNREALSEIVIPGREENESQESAIE